MLTKPLFVYFSGIVTQVKDKCCQVNEESVKWKLWTMHFVHHMNFTSPLSRHGFNWHWCQLGVSRVLITGPRHTQALTVRMENINYNFEGGSSKQEYEEDLCKVEHPTPVPLSNQGKRQGMVHLQSLFTHNTLLWTGIEIVCSLRSGFNIRFYVAWKSKFE